MNNLTQQVKHGAEQALASISHGWRELKERASGALTHFKPHTEKGPRNGDSEWSTQDSWGFLAADVVDSMHSLIVRLEAPGMSRSDFKIELRDQMLSIQGDKRIEREFEDDGHHTIQCAYGSFRRDVPLPTAVNADEVTATYRDGVLRVVLLKTQGASARRFRVNVN